MALHDDGTFDQMLTDTTGRVDSCSGTWKYSSAPDGGVIQLNGVFNVVEHVIFRKTSFATEPYFRRGRVCIKVNEDSLYLHD